MAATAAKDKLKIKYLDDRTVADVPLQFISHAGQNFNRNGLKIMGAVTKPPGFWTKAKARAVNATLQDDFKERDVMWPSK